MELKIKCVNTATSSDGSQYGKFVIEPLERGFGITIGNSLRRVLLSSLEGTAVTSARIEGITHEYTAIPGVLEDVIWLFPWVACIDSFQHELYKRENHTVKDREEIWLSIMNRYDAGVFTCLNVRSIILNMESLN